MNDDFSASPDHFANTNAPNGDEPHDHPSHEHHTHHHGPPHHDRHDSAQSHTNNLAIVSFITAFIFWPVGLICGLVARREIRHGLGSGSGLAISGIVISALTGAFWSVLLILALLVSSGVDPAARCDNTPLGYRGPLASCVFRIGGPGPVMNGQGGAYTISPAPTRYWSGSSVTPNISGPSPLISRTPNVSGARSTVFPPVTTVP